MKNVYVTKSRWIVCQIEQTDKVKRRTGGNVLGKSLTRKIIESHYVSGSMTPGEEVFIKVDQTLTHDINAVMTYLAFEATGLDRRRTHSM